MLTTPENASDSCADSVRDLHPKPAGAIKVHVDLSQNLTGRTFSSQLSVLAMLRRLKCTRYLEISLEVLTVSESATDSCEDSEGDLHPKPACLRNVDVELCAIFRSESCFPRNCRVFEFVRTSVFKCFRMFSSHTKAPKARGDPRWLSGPKEHF